MSTHRDQSFCGIHIFVKYIASSSAMSTTLTACRENHPDRGDATAGLAPSICPSQISRSCLFAIVFGERAVEVPCIRIGGNWKCLDLRVRALLSCVGIRGVLATAARRCSSQVPRLCVYRQKNFWPREFIVALSLQAAAAHGYQLAVDGHG